MNTVFTICSLVYYENLIYNQEDILLHFHNFDKTNKKFWEEVKTINNIFETEIKTKYSKNIIMQI